MSQARPDPGGGAAAAYSAGVGLALLTKIIRLENSRPYNHASQGKFWAEQLAETRRLTRIFQHLRQVDVEAYLTMSQALAVRQQGANLQRAVEEATRCPWQIMEQALVALGLVVAAGAQCRRHLLSDLLVATDFWGRPPGGLSHRRGQPFPDQGGQPAPGVVRPSVPSLAPGPGGHPSAAQPVGGQGPRRA